MRGGNVLFPNYFWGELIISALLSINIIERNHCWCTIVAYPICWSVCLSIKCFVAKLLIGLYAIGVVSGVG